jgi:hypothetical protein
MSRKSVSFDRVTVTQQSSSDEEEDDDIDSEGSEEQKDESATGSGWSDAMNRLLNSHVRSKNFILSKAKKDRDVVTSTNKEVRNEFEVVTESGEKELVTDAVAVAEKEKKNRKDDASRKLLQKASQSDVMREAELNAIATRGVVQLFNAVNQQRFRVSKKIAEAGPLETQKDRVRESVSKADFLNSLKDDTTDVQPQSDPPAKKRKHQKDNQEKIRFKDVLSDNVIQSEG